MTAFPRSLPSDIAPEVMRAERKKAAEGCRERV